MGRGGLDQLRQAAPIRAEEIREELSNDGASERFADVGPDNFAVLAVEGEPSAFAIEVGFELSQTRLVAQGIEVLWWQPLRCGRLPGCRPVGKSKDAVARQALARLQAHSLQRLLVQPLDRVAVDCRQADAHAVFLQASQSNEARPRGQ